MDILLNPKGMEVLYKVRAPHLKPAVIFAGRIPYLALMVRGA
jgi:hypothetical protein